MEREIFSHIQARYRTLHLAPTTLSTMFVQQQQQQQQHNAMPCHQAMTVERREGHS